MAKTKKKTAKGKKKGSKTKKSRATLDVKTDVTAISGGAMKDAFRQAFLRREI